MRRRDREVKEENRIDEIISRSKICRIGYYDDGEVYIVPLNFGYIREEGELALYFHSAMSGRKIDLIGDGCTVGFELDANFGLMTGKEACDYSAYYASVIGNGNLHLLEDRDEKIRALKIIMKHNTGKDDWEFSDANVDRVAVMKLLVSKYSCKEHRK